MSDVDAGSNVFVGQDWPNFSEAHADEHPIDNYPPDTAQEYTDEIQNHIKGKM